VLIRCQPAISPHILADLPWLVEQAKRSGAWGFQTEGLKLRVAAPQSEKEHFRRMGRLLGINDIYAEFRSAGRKTASDLEFSIERKIEYTQLARALAHQEGLRYLSADNDPETIALSDSDECCGTERLRNYEKFAYNYRTKLFTGKPWHELENGIERAVYVGRGVEEGIMLRDYVRKKLKKQGVSIDEDQKAQAGG